MKKRTFIHTSNIIVFLILCWVQVKAFQTEERYFDTISAKNEALTIAICYPSTGSIRAVMALMQEGFFPSEDVIIVGCYHEKEITNYRSSQNYVETNNLDWFKFHKIIGDISKDHLFENNACSDDFKKIFRLSDGIIFFGGADIPPEIFKEKTSLLTEIRTPYRHYMELSFVFHLLGGYQNIRYDCYLQTRPDYPVLGICLGEQTLNVGTGGTLIQDIWFEQYGKTYVEDVIALGKENWHTNPVRRLYPLDKLTGINYHRIRLVEESKFGTEMGFTKDDTPYILSSHHQAAKKLGKGLRIAATSMDGKIIEAVEHERFNSVLGIQFHPESPSNYDRQNKIRITLEDGEGFNVRTFLENNPPSFEFHKKLWGWFVEIARKYHDSKR